VLGALKGSLKVIVWSTGIVVMVAMVMLHVTRIRYISLLAHLVGGDLSSGVEGAGDLSSRRFPRVVDLVLSTCVISLVLED
jgi:hypothetical protein